MFLFCSTLWFYGKEDQPMALAAAPRHPAALFPARGRPVERFSSAEEAWFWTMSALKARRDGARYTANLGGVERPCEADDVVKCLDTLYRRRRIDLEHARVLRRWGDRQMAPSPARRFEHNDWQLWREAMDRLEWLLRVKGIVG
jgi:hypothetical protein